MYTSKKYNNDIIQHSATVFPFFCALNRERPLSSVPVEFQSNQDVQTIHDIQEDLVIDEIS